MTVSPAELSPISGDPLMPVDEVARWLGVSPVTITSYVVQGGLKSLDEGKMIAAGDRSTPLIRSREVRRYMKEQFEALKTAARPSISENLIENVPLLVAYTFVMALQDKDQKRVWDASSEASQQALVDAPSLFKWWSDYLDIERAAEPGVTSGIYSIGERAVAVMYVADTPPSGGIMQRPTMVIGNPLALVEDPDGWRVDQPLQARCREWKHLAGAPQPGRDSGAGASGPD
jgi:hypothetical protein